MLWKAFGSLFSILGCLTKTYYKMRSLILPQFDKPCFVDPYGRSGPFLTETEEAWTAGGRAEMGGKNRRRVRR